MKILEPAPTFQAITIKCPHCTAVLQADKPEDFKRVADGDFRESWDYAVCTCPCCHGRIQVDKDSFPKHIYEKLERTR